MSVAQVLRAPIALALVALSASAVHAQQGGAFAYPNAGQSEQQQSKDRYECHSWAVSQTGFDPTTAPPLASAPPPPPGGSYSDQPQQQSSSGGFLGIGNGGMMQGTGVMGDAATGAALGAAGGAIAGNAGKGAAIGAVASTLFGAFNRASDKPAPQPQVNNDYARQQQAAAAQQYNQRLQQTNEYNRAFGTCMAARNYTVN